MNKRKLSTALFVLLLVVGLGVLLYPTLSDLYARYQLSQEVSEYNEVVEGEKANYDAYWEAAEEYNEYLLTKSNQLMVSEEEEEWISTLLNPLGNGMMGYIEIPKIGVDLPIYQGTEEKELQSGAGYWLGTSLPTGGTGTHCVLTAHTGLVRAKLFTDIDQLVEGDTFTLTILDRVMTYEVDQILITEPSETDALLVQEDADYVTLYTCYPYGVNTQRLLVRGHRIATPEEPDTLTAVTDTTRQVLIAYPELCAVGLALLLVLLLLLLRRRRKERKQQAEAAAAAAEEALREPPADTPVPEEPQAETPAPPEAAPPETATPEKVSLEAATPEDEPTEQKAENNPDGIPPEAAAPGGASPEHGKGEPK